MHRNFRRSREALWTFSRHVSENFFIQSERDQGEVVCMVVCMALRTSGNLGSLTSEELRHFTGLVDRRDLEYSLFLRILLLLLCSGTSYKRIFGNFIIWQLGSFVRTVCFTSKSFERERVQVYEEENQNVNPNAN